MTTSLAIVLWSRRLAIRCILCALRQPLVDGLNPWVEMTGYRITVSWA